jgi:hypothetical protein
MKTPLWDLSVKMDDHVYSAETWRKVLADPSQSGRLCRRQKEMVAH